MAVMCALCMNVDGPWTYYEGIGFVCEDCEENGKLEAKLKEKENDQG